MTHARRARRAGIAALLLWPASYTWMPLAERSPAWVLVLVLLAEIGAVVLGVTGVWGGVQARRREGDSQTARWAIAVGALAVALVIGGNVVGLALLS
jgi:predicted MFS family arabinose efflux permease